MQFKISFKLQPDGHDKITVKWTDGNLTGLRSDVAIVENLLHAYNSEPVYLSPTGPISEYNHLQNPLAFLRLCQSLFFGVKASGDMPVVSAPEPKALS